MKMKYVSVIIMGLTVISLVSFQLIAIPVSYAQSSQTWSEPINLSNSGASTKPSIVVDGKGIVHVVWIDQFEGYQYTESADGGKSWTTPKKANFPFAPAAQIQPVLIAGKNDEIHIFWLDNESALYYGRASSSKFGQPSSWAGTVKLSDSVIYFDATLSAKNILHLSYIDNLGTATKAPGLYYQHLDRARWTVATNLYSSKYYRSLQSADANVSLATSTTNDLDQVIVAWDDRSQKRIFWANSGDGGNAWDTTMEISGPAELAGSEMPYNIKVSALEQKILLMWQVGNPGSQCVQYSQWSLDGGVSFENPVKMLDEFAACPKQSSFLIQENDMAVASLDLQDEISLVAWDESRWSKPQRQSELSAFPNPLTFDNVILGCQDISIYNETLFVVGCDTDGDGDIWFRSRPLGALEEWFPPPSAWTAPFTVTSTRQLVSSLTMVADDKNNIHGFWVQAPASEGEDVESTIIYSRWDGNRWSKSSNIIGGFSGVPTQLSSTVDKQGRILLSWVEGMNGDLYFSWANSERAQMASEWYEPQQLPSLSQLNSAPDILVDDLNRIVVVYTVPLNENRGVYIVQSTDLGRTWSHPILIFDAVAAGWSSVDRSAVDLSGDGNLHVLFSRPPLRETDQARGLYYSQSRDGGISWSQPETISERTIQWSQILGRDTQVLHRLWQESNGLASDILHQVSRDGGASWENPVKVLSTSDALGSVDLAESTDGHLYLAQTHIVEESVVIDSHEWDGARWIAQEAKEIDLDAKSDQASIVLAINHQGVLNVLVSVMYPKPLTSLQNKVIGFGKSLEITTDGSQTSTFEIVTPAALESLTPASNTQATPTELSSLANAEDPPAPPKNIIGIALVVGLALLIVMFTRSGKKS